MYTYIYRIYTYHSISVFISMPISIRIICTCRYVCIFMFYWNYIGSNLGNPKNQAIYQSDQLVILAGSSISNHSDASKCKYPIELHPQAYADHDNCVIYLFKNDNHAFVDDLPISGVYDQVGVYCQFMAFLTGKLWLSMMQHKWILG